MKSKSSQISLFDLEELTTTPEIASIDLNTRIPLSDETKERLSNYNLDLYIEDLNQYGLSKTWDYICEYVLLNGEQEGFLSISNFGEMYEIGLAIQDKLLKKNSGQYYTPEDVACVMSNWFLKCPEENVCDVACGTGKLIMTYLDLLGFEEARSLLNKGNVFLYDFDCTALKICKTSLIVKYRIENVEVIHDYCCDFLDKGVQLPDNCKVISNPPYFKIEKINMNWEQTEVLLESREFYSVFMEKVFTQASSVVIITPFSFIAGAKFSSLRRVMSDLGKGFIVSFDNVPGNIFCGRKHGVFNTNTANSVRAAITVFTKDKNHHGFQVSPLIRFKNEERKRLLITDVLERTLPKELQIVDEHNDTFKKISSELESVYYTWVDKSSFILKDLISKTENEYLLDIPNTCRYYTTASSKKLKRTGSITLYCNNIDIYNFVYCLINSSFSYWWWRIYDGGITYPVSLLNSMPVPINLLTEKDKKFFSDITKEMISNERNFIILKKNAGVDQENIKFPDEYRKRINQRILSILGCDDSISFDGVHANSFFG